MSALPVLPESPPADTGAHLFEVHDKVGLIQAAPIVVDWLGKCAKASAGRYDIRYLGESHFSWWILADAHLLAIAVSEEVEHPSGERWLSLLFAAGRSVQLWLPHFADFRRIAKDRGCVGIECVVRKGFAPKLIGLGMRETGRLLEVRV